MKKKNGFTLVELLVTIALVLSITGIAIASLVSLNKRKQNEAWDHIKEEIETAAKDYFYANEYLYEDLTEDYEATVSVGKLVSEDYLGKITDPRTNKKISDCSVVKYTNKNKKINISFDESSINSAATTCDITYVNKTTIKETKAPSVEVKYFKDSNCSESANDNNGWFNKEKLGGTTLYVKVNPANDNKTKLKSISLNSGKEMIPNTCFALTDDGKNKKYTVTATGVNGRKATIEQTYNKDTVAPTFYHQFSYKIFNVAKKQPKDFTDTNNEYGLTLIPNNSTFLGLTIKNAAYLYWNNKQEDGSKILDGLKFNKVEVRYNSNTTLNNVTDIDLEIKKDGSYYTPRKGTIEDFVGISNNIYFHDYSSSFEKDDNIRLYTASWREFKELDGIRLKFKCTISGKDCSNDVNYFNDAGISLFTKESTELNATDEMIKHNNYIRMQMRCEDSLSGCNTKSKIKYKKQYPKNNANYPNYENKGTIGEQEVISFMEGTGKTEEDARYLTEGVYIFTIFDEAGNKTELYVDSNGKFK